MGGRDGGHGGRGNWVRKRKSGASAGGGEDHRWRKKKMMKNSSGLVDGLPSDMTGPSPGGDTLDTCMQPVSGNIASDGSGNGVPDKSSQPEKKKARKEAVAKQKAKLARVKEKRRKHFEEARAADDTNMRNAPADFFWEKYVEWAGPERLSALERDSDAWSTDNVMFLHVDQKTKPAGQAPLIAAVKTAVPGLYARAKDSRDGSPGICVMLVASSGLRASHLGSAMYDGKPVGKLFSKHISKEEQRDWLKQHAKKKAAPTAVGTARRLQLLYEEGHLSLACTSVFIVDMNRDEKQRGILDMPATRNELFEFVHSSLRPLITSGQVKVVLHCSQ